MSTPQQPTTLQTTFWQFQRMPTSDSSSPRRLLLAVTHFQLAESQYPIIIGDDFQFDFRQHPTLGTIGAFSKYGRSLASSCKVRETVSQPPSIEKLQFAIEHSRGEVRRALLPELEDSMPRRIINSVAQITNVSIGAHDHTAHGEGSDEFPCAASGYLRDAHGLSWLLIAKTPPYLPAIFPRTLSRRNGNLIAAMSLGGGFWVRSAGHPRSISSESAYRVYPNKQYPVFVNWDDEKMFETEVDLEKLR
jgi:hypothetical protein